MLFACIHAGVSVLMRYLCAILLICIGLTSVALPAYIPNTESYVYRLQGFSHSLVPVMHNQTDQTSLGSDHRISPFTYGGIAAAHVGGAVAGYNSLTNLWGTPDGRFHFKDETSDYLAFNDEVSHLFISYKLAQGFSSVYRGLGFTEGKARFLGVLESALIMTAIEYPVDAYNPTQGFGLTDIVADYAGIGLAWWKSVDPNLANFDLKVSVKSLSGQRRTVLAYDASDYDNFIYWLTYRYEFAVLGAGYSTDRETPKDVQPQLLLGIGTTIPDLIRPVSSKLAKRLKPLELYFFNFNLKAL
jgi:hypothetical protein